VQCTEATRRLNHAPFLFKTSAAIRVTVASAWLTTIRGPFLDMHLTHTRVRWTATETRSRSPHHLTTTRGKSLPTGSPVPWHQVHRLTVACTVRTIHILCARDLRRNEKFVFCAMSKRAHQFTRPYSQSPSSRRTFHCRCFRRRHCPC
jgi:hypothetical protein